MTYFVTYADERMTISAMKCIESAGANGADMTYTYSPGKLSKEFTEINKGNLAIEKGAGLYIWKPYIIWRALQHCKDGDILIYSDCGVKVIAPLRHIIDVMDQDIFLFTNGWPQVMWTKGDVMETINGGLTPVEFHQVQASAIFFKVNEVTRDFIKEWLLWCQMPGFCDNSPSKLPNHPEFAEHRWDQSILTCLQIKYGYKLHWWADRLWYESQRYRWPEDRYPAIFEHHRKRNSDW